MMSELPSAWKSRSLDFRPVSLNRHDFHLSQSEVVFPGTPGKNLLIPKLVRCSRAGSAACLPSRLGTYAQLPPGPLMTQLKYSRPNYGHRSAIEPIRADIGALNARRKKSPLIPLVLGIVLALAYFSYRDLGQPTILEDNLLDEAVAVDIKSNQGQEEARAQLAIPAAPGIRNSELSASPVLEEPAASEVDTAPIATATADIESAAQIPSAAIA